MTALYPSQLLQYLSVLLVFLRLLGLFLLLPGFSHRAIPGNVRLLLALSMSLALHSMVKGYLPAVPEDIAGLAFAGLKETAIGLLMGFAAYLTFEGINLAAQFVGYQLGFGSASLIDPQNQASVAIIVPLQGWLALLIFFMADMHHDVLKVFVASFQMTRQLNGELLVTGALLKTITVLSGNLFLLAIRLAAPFTVLVLAVNAALGIVGRMMPQMNIMFFSFPITILLGLCGIYLVAPDLLDCLEQVLGDVSGNLVEVLRAL